MTNPYHHEFQPWRIEGERCVLNQDEWERVREYAEHAKCDDDVRKAEGLEPEPLTVYINADPWADIDNRQMSYEDELIAITGCDRRRRDLLTLIAECPHLRFIICTDWPERARETWPSKVMCVPDMITCPLCSRGWPDDVDFSHCDCGCPVDSMFPAHEKLDKRLPNLTLCVNVSNQREADERLTWLEKLKPLVGHVGIHYVPIEAVDVRPITDIDWLWIRALEEIRANLYSHELQKEIIGIATSAADQAVAAGVPVWNELGDERARA